MNKVGNVIHGMIKYSFTIMSGLILVLCLLGQEMEYAAKQEFAGSNRWYLVLGILVIGLLGVIADKLVKNTAGKGKDRLVMLVLNGVFGVLLIFCTYHYYFKTGWDAGLVIDQAKLLAAEDYKWLDNVYFARCSNNLFTTLLFSGVIRVGSLLGFGNYYFYLVAFQCVLWAAVGYMIYGIADVYCKKKSMAVLVWILYLLLIGCSPWVVVPYTDNIAMFFLTAILYLYAGARYPFLLGMLLFVGASVKPQIWIVVIAFVIVKAPGILSMWVEQDESKRKPKEMQSDKQNRHWNEVLKRLAWGVAGLLIGIILVKGSAVLSPYTLEPGREYAMPHYLMQGLNRETNGIFDTEDVLYTESFPTQKERDTANYKEAFRRLQEMGPWGFLDHLKRKILTTYNDGTLSWGKEGGFFTLKFYSGNGKIRDFFWQLYFPDGKYYSHFQSYMQVIWMGILFMTIFSLLDRRKDENMLILALSLIGVACFELLFEPRARHLMIYVPAMLILAVNGWELLQEKIKQGIIAFLNRICYDKKV